jgi:hypothetical protein
MIKYYDYNIDKNMWTLKENKFKIKYIKFDINNINNNNYKILDKNIL